MNGGGVYEKLWRDKKKCRNVLIILESQNNNNK